MAVKGILNWIGGGEERKTDPRVPDGLRVYVIGDIHGRADLLEEMHQKIIIDAASAANQSVVYLGDYVDRGPSSRQVIETLRKGRSQGLNGEYLKGNHEQTVLQFLQDPEVLSAWRSYGGLETLNSYGVDLTPLRTEGGFELIRRDFATKIPQDHREFLENLKLTLEIGDYFFVHAGIKPGIPLSNQKEEDLIWIRDEFLTSKANHGQIIVHGHTPVDEPEIWPNRINIDTGAYITNRLTCLVLEGDTKRLL